MHETWKKLVLTYFCSSNITVMKVFFNEINYILVDWLPPVMVLIIDMLIKLLVSQQLLYSYIENFSLCSL